MSGLDEDLAKFSGLLEAFAAQQRQDALFQARKQRITIQRRVGDMQIALEAVVDEGISASEIFDSLAPADAAIDRLKAKADLSDHYTRMANTCDALDLAVKKLTGLRDEYRAANTSANQNRRNPIIFTDAQAATLDNQQKAIRDMFAEIEGHQVAAAECRRILGGEDPFHVLDEQMTRKLDALRGARPDAA